MLTTPAELPRVGPWHLAVAHLDDTQPHTRGSDPLSGAPVEGSWYYQPDTDTPGHVRMVSAYSGHQLRVARVRSITHSSGDVPAAMVMDLARDLHRMAAAQLTHVFGVPQRSRELVAGTRTRLTDDHLRDVAAVYQLGGSRGRVVVMDKWQVPERTASNWIAAARRRGILGPAPGPGRAGSADPAAPSADAAAASRQLIADAIADAIAAATDTPAAPTRRRKAAR